MRLKPVNDKIVVKEKEKPTDEVTASGIILPDTVADGGLIEGKVVAVGEGMYSANGTIIPIAVNEGDTILYNKMAMKSEHKMDGETFIIMSQNEVMSVVEDK
jgi:chaperonin GroES